MKTASALAVIAAGLLMSLSLVAQQADAPLEELETALVTGEHPGPGLWRVSKGDHVLWVLGTYGPLPKGMIWRSQNVESRIAESQEVLLPGVVDVQFDLDIGFFKALSLIPAAMKMDNLRGGKTLKDILPAETYKQWRTLSEKYMARSHSADKSRPWAAIDKLRTSAYRKQKLVDGPVVSAIVKDAAKKHKVKLTRLPDVKPQVKMEDFEALLKHVSKLDNVDVECFTTSLGKVEADIEQMKALANAWAHGDVDALRNLHELPEVGKECDNVMEMALTTGDSALAESTRKMAADFEKGEVLGRIRLESGWIRAASAALDRNLSTFAVLPIRDVVVGNGYVAKLRELGYEVEGQ